MVRTQVQLTEEQARAVRRMAAQEGVSVAEIIRQSIEARVRASGTPSQEEVRRRALEVAGTLRGGPEDLSARHDDYLAEAYAE